jgi:hypothetical protein
VVRDVAERMASHEVARNLRGSGELSGGRRMINPHGERDVPAWEYRFQARVQERSLDSPRNEYLNTIAWNRIGSMAAQMETIPV